ncbi:MAG: S-layer protein [Methanospirillaceae archaeon]|nr:S-layer protein [Methanospirillaceae archaeon]
MSKRIIIPIIVFVLFLIPPISADNPTVMVTGYAISPPVVMPNDAATITVTLSNTAQQASRTALSSMGTGTTYSMSESLTTPLSANIQSASLKTSDFQIVNGWYNNVGEIGPGQSVNLTFYVIAPPVEGLYFPEVWIRVRDSASVKYPIPVNVNSPYSLSKSPLFSINRIVPDQVTPGSSFDIHIDLTNAGKAKAHDIRVGVHSPDDSISSLTPEQYFISDLGPGETHTQNLSFATDKSIPTGIFQFPLSVQYLTTDNLKHEQKAQIGVRIQGKGELGISKYQISPQMIKTGDTFSLITRIENTGTGDAKSVRVTLEIPFEGMKEAFVGTIKPDNDAPAIFNLKATQAGEIPYQLTIAFQDDYGDHAITEPLSLSVQETNNTGMYLLIILLIIAGGAVILYKKRFLP